MNVHCEYFSEKKNGTFGKEMKINGGTDTTLLVNSVSRRTSSIEKKKKRAKEIEENSIKPGTT